MSDRDAAPSLLAQALAHVPTHRQAHQTAQAMSEALTKATPGLGPNEARAAVWVMLDVLGAFGALHRQGDAVRASDQVSSYLIRSLMWYAQRSLAFVDEATGEGALPGHGLLRHMELRRVHLSQLRGIAAEPTREQDAALVLFRRMVRGKPCLLFQWDERARQYQLIGGRIEPNETPHAAAIRECCEEVGEHQPVPWQHGQDFTLTSVLPNDAAIESTAISPTYGALTRYRFYVFHAVVLATRMTLGKADRWIPIEHIQNRSEQLRLGNTHLYDALNAALVGGLAGLASSFAVTANGASAARYRSVRR